MKGVTLKDNIAEVSRAFPASICSNEEQSTNKKFLNPAQLLIYNFGAREMYVCGARGMGKTTVMSLRLDNCQMSIPRGTGAFMGSSIKQLYCNTMPNLIKSLEQHRGYIEGVHFFRGRPDKRLNWDKPLATPRIWENVISFPNGNICYMLSTGVASAGNGMNLCYVLCDETRYLNWQVYVESIRPALRGDVFPNGGHPGWSKQRNPNYLSQFFVSDAGIIRKQQEWEKEEEEQTDAINDEICQRLAELKYAEEYDALHKTNYAWKLAHNKKFIEELEFLRCQSKVFMRFSSIHNISVLGEDFIKARKRDMPPLLFARQILGLKAGVDKSQLFYPNYNPDVHLYSDDDDAVVSSILNNYQSKHHSVIDIGGTTKKIDYEAPDLQSLASHADDCTFDMDVVPNAPLCIAHDFNHNVNTIVTGQETRLGGVPTAQVLSSMFTVHPRMLEDLMEDWCKYYAVHRVTCRDVNLYYDSTAKQGGTYASRDAEKYKFYNIIGSILTKHGWLVHLIDLGSPMPHDAKFTFINSCFAGTQRLFPRINRLRNDYLIASLESARTTMKFGKLHKDKSSEKKTSGLGLSEGNDLGENNYSDMSDAFDTLMRGMCNAGGYSSNKTWGRVSVSLHAPTTW